MKGRSCVKKKKKKGIICKPKDGRPRTTAPVGPEKKKAKPASKRSGASTTILTARCEHSGSSSDSSGGSSTAAAAATASKQSGARTEAESAKVEMEAVAPVAATIATGEAAAAAELASTPQGLKGSRSKHAERKSTKRKEVAALAAQQRLQRAADLRTASKRQKIAASKLKRQKTESRQPGKRGEREVKIGVRPACSFVLEPPSVAASSLRAAQIAGGPLSGALLPTVLLAAPAPLPARLGRTAAERTASVRAVAQAISSQGWCLCRGGLPAHVSAAAASEASALYTYPYPYPYPYP